MKNLFTKILFSLFILAGISNIGWAQCIATFNFPSTPPAAPSCPAPGPVTINTCNWGGDYTDVSGFVAGNTYRFTSTGGYFITVSDVTNTTFYASGTSPVNFTPLTSGTYRLHYNTNAACGTSTSCQTTTMELIATSPATSPPAGALSGVYNIPNVCGYTTLKQVIDSLNANGVSGAVTINLNANFTAPAGGYDLGSTVLNASTNATNTLTFNGGGNTITGYTGTSTYADVIFDVQGTDYVTINNFNFVEAAGNTTTTTKMDCAVRGICLTATDGCKNLTISNNTINFANATNAWITGQFGINVQTALPTATSYTTSVTPTSAAGQHENIVIKGNTITNVHGGIQVRGHTTLATGYNVNNVTIGGDNVADGNIISNYGSQAPTVYTGTSYGIYTYYTCGLTKIKNNTVSSTINGGSTYGIYKYYSNTGLTNNPQLSIMNKNDVSIQHTGTSGTMGAIYAFSSSAQGDGAWTYIDSNTVHDCSIASTSTFYGFYNNNGYAKKRMKGNSFTNFVRTGTSGSSYGIYHYGLNSNVAQADTLIQIAEDNIIDSLSHLTNTGTSYFYMMYLYGNIPTLCKNNTIKNATTDGTSTSTNYIYGIYNGGYLATNNIETNRISNLNMLNTGTTKRCVGIYHYQFNSTTYNLTPNLTTINRNNVNGISNTSSGTNTECGGFWIESSSDIEIRNNFISDITAPNASQEDGVFGMRIEGYSNSYPYTARVYNNTIQLGFVSPLVSTGANFGCSGISVDNVNPNAVSLDLRNNIIRVNATPNGTGRVRALGIQWLTPAKFLTTSNNNIYFAPNAANSFLVMNSTTGYNLTNDPNFNTSCGLYKTDYPHEFATFTENNMVAATSPNTFAPTGASKAESGGQSIPSVTVDYDNVARSATPDIGALEFSGISGGDIVPPTVAYTDLPDKVCLDNPTLSATITDLGGVSVAAGTAPRIYYKKASEANALAGNTSANNGWKWTASTSTSSPFSFTMDYSLLTSAVVAGDTIEYFVVAQDSATTPNVASTAAVYNTGFCPTSVNIYSPAGAAPISGTKSFTVLPVPSLSATADKSSLCFAGDVALGSSLMGSLLDPSISWQWQKSPTGSATWTNLSGANTENVTVIGQSSSTDYQLLVSCPSPQGLIATSSLVTVSNITPVVDSVKNDTVCGTGTASLIAYVDTASYTVNWYDASTGGSNVGSGDTLNISGLTATDTFYAEPNGGVGKVLITEVCQFTTSAYVNPGPPFPTNLDDPIELTNTGTSPIDISGWKLEVTGSATGTYTIPSGNIIPAGAAIVIDRGPGTTDIPGVYLNGTILPSTSSSSTNGYILSDASGNVQDVTATNGYNVVGTGTPAATASDWSGTTGSSGGTGGIRRTVVVDNNSGSDWTIATGSNTTNYGQPNVAFTPTGCAGPRVAVIANYTTPTAVTASNDTTVCADGSVIVPLTVSSANTAYIYTWSPAAGLNTTTGDTVMANPLVATQYIVTGDDGFCQSTDTINVMVSAPFYDTASASLSNICAGDSVNLIAGDSVPPLPPYCASGATNGFDTKIDTVSFAGVTTGTALTAQETYTDNTAIVIPAAAGVPLPLSVRNGSSTNNYYGGTLWVYIDYDQSGTFDPAEMVYTYSLTGLNSIPPTTVTIPTTALNGLTRMRLVLPESSSLQPCGTWSYGETEDYTVNISGATPVIVPSYTYSWMPGNLSGASQTVTPTTTTTYVATQTNAFGCTAQDSVTINVGATPTLAVTATPSATVCPGDTITVMSGATGADTYTWNGNPAGMDTVLAPAVSGTYTVVATDTMNGCSATDSILVTVNPLPVFTPSATPDTICSGDSVQLNTTPQFSDDYILTSIPHAPLTPTVTPIVAVTGDDASANITLPFTFDFYGISYTSINVSTNGFTSFTSTASGCCTGQNLPSASNPSAVIAVAWEDLNQNLGGNIDYYTEGTAPNRKFVIRYDSIPYFGSGGADIIAQIVLNESTNTIEIHGTAGGPNASNNTTQGIENSTGTLATTIPGRNSQSPWAMSNEGWLFTPSTNSGTTVWSPSGSLNTSNVPNPVANPTTTTNYLVTVTQNGCVATDSVEVFVKPLPTITASATPTAAICPSDTAMLSASGGNTYMWSPGALAGANQNVTPAVTTNYVVEGTDATSGCKNTDTVTVNVNAAPALSVTVDSNETCPGSMNAGATALTSSQPIQVFFEGFVNAPSSQASLPDVLLPGWTSPNNGTPVWSWDANTTSSGSTGPNGGFNTAGYAYLETSSGSGGDDTLRSPTILLPIVTAPLDLKFYTFMYGATINKIELYIDNGSSMTQIWSDSGQSQLSDIDPWDTVALNLSAYAGQTVQLVYVGYRGTSFTGDIAIDDIEISYSPVPNLLWSTSDTTNSITGLTTGTYTVTATNTFGCSSTDTATITSINPAPNVTATPTTATSCYGDSITIVGSGASTYTISGGAMNNIPFVPTSSQYVVTGVDTNGCSDTATVSVSLGGATLFSEDFSDNTAGWILDTEWEIDSAQVSTCATGGLGEDPALDHSPTADNGVAGVVIGGCASTALHSTYYLTSPIINTAGVLDSLELSFYRWLNSDYTPYMQNFVEIYDGSAWVVLWQSGGSPSIADNSWNLQTYDITAYKNASMRIRFGHLVGSVGAYNAPSWNIDDITISSPASIPNLSNATANNAASTPGNSTGSKTQNTSAATQYYDNNCDLIAQLSNNGSSMGNTVANVTVTATVPTHNGQPFVARWYEVSPTNNIAADATFYFTQDDFDDYNTYATANSWPLLPASSIDAVGIANLRITKNDNGGLGVNPVVLTPSSVTWNAPANRWEVTVSVPSFSQFRAHAVNPGNAALSVEYKDFTVTKQATSDLVAWTTVSERNNSHFNVQRSLDGNTFETLGTVQSKAVNGLNSRELSYTFVDETPQIGHNYYRLEQVDMDQRTSYTKSIDIIWGAAGSVVSIYPNPTKGLLNVDISVSKVSQTEIKLLDMSGRVVKSVIAKTEKGLNNIKLDMSELASGVYGIQIFENNILTHNSKVNKKD